MRAAILARLMLIEARRGGLPWLVVAAIALAVALGGFLAQLAVTESRLVQAAVVAALLRGCAVFLVAMQVVSSVVREIDDKGLELMLSLPLSRASQYLGRLGGFAACGVAVAAAVALPLLLWSPPIAVACWGVSLAGETLLVAATALFFAMTLAQPLPAIAATAGLYLLARSISAIQAISAGPLVEPSLAQAFAHHAVDALAFLLPALDQVTRSEWLLYGPPPASLLAQALAGLALYTLLLAAAGLFDFQRRGI